ncbi:MAG: bifunctional [glutamate--ammonia ligase]-adenylyl-L-tyrosine phosphorylase/[glutamate--ammonia-ligase] adenylyltransferase [Candidatus Nitrotoga sp.]
MNTQTSASVLDFEAALQRTLHCSRYAQRLLASNEALLTSLRTDYLQPCSATHMQQWLAAMPISDETSLSVALRQLRKRVMLQLLTRDLGGQADLTEVVRTVSALAEIVIQQSQIRVMQSLVEQHGQPRSAGTGAIQTLLVIGMGKLGGEELNVSSDIDLIFIYPEDGETGGADDNATAHYRSISNHEFFSKLGKRIINLIDEITAEGFVFRVDMRLRPYGDSGPLVMSLAALEEYLVTQGREWERYAWIKARVVAPSDSPATQELMQLIKPFIFRKYLDFGAFDSMRKLHIQIQREVQRRDRQNNIKLGPGGIREIEFIAQVFQLMRGGQNASLRIRPTLQVLQRLAEKEMLAPEIVAGLSRAYVFLRNLEHRLQYLDDQQTQDIPDHTIDQEILALGMGYADYAALLVQLNAHRQLVSEQFALIFSTQQELAGGIVVSDFWHGNMQVQEVAAALNELGYAGSTALSERLVQIRQSGRYRQLPASSQRRLDKLIPQFITLCVTQYNSDQALLRVLKLLESISRRASYLAFLAEYPKVLPRLVDIASASEWASEYLVQHPVLLDELLDAREIYRAPDWVNLGADLQTELTQHDDDIELQMDALRRFQHSQIFHLLAMDIQNLLTLETLSDHLSDLADLILHHVLQICWRDMSSATYSTAADQPKFSIVAYGKLGGRELGYAADLDIIFLYQDENPDAAQIYARLAQRINSALSSYTASGRLYETDLRLRPNGASGLLVSSIEAFAQYQNKDAWVWEHQALTRARFCAGDEQIGAKFETIRTAILCKPRDINTLRAEIIKMRHKMLDAHRNDSDLFDIKHDHGGMVDVEFIVQFLVLAYAHQYPELTKNSGNIALLNRAAELKLINQDMVQAVCNIYRAERALQHKMRLNNESASRIGKERLDVRPVMELWKQLFEK